MSDVTPLRAVPHAPKRRTLWSSFSRTAQGAILVATFAGSVIAGYVALGSVVTASELAPVAAEVQRLDGEQEVQFRLHGILKQQVDSLETRAEWTNAVLWKMAQDQGLDRGREPVAPPPEPVVAAHPTPTPRSP